MNSSLIDPLTSNRALYRNAKSTLLLVHYPGSIARLVLHRLRLKQWFSTQLKECITFVYLLHGPLLNFTLLFSITSYFLICKYTVNKVVNHFDYKSFKISPRTTGLIFSKSISYLDWSNFSNKFLSRLGGFNVDDFVHPSHTSLRKHPQLWRNVYKIRILVRKTMCQQ